MVLQTPGPFAALVCRCLQPFSALTPSAMQATSMVYRVLWLSYLIRIKWSPRVSPSARANWRRSVPVDWAAIICWFSALRISIAAAACVASVVTLKLALSSSLTTYQSSSCKTYSPVSSHEILWAISAPSLSSRSSSSTESGSLPSWLPPPFPEGGVSPASQSSDRW